MLIERRRRRKRKLEVVDSKVVFRKRVEHSFELPPEIAEWAKRNEKLLDWLVFDSPIAPYLRHPRSVRTLVLLLYARANRIPIAKLARELGMPHEQLYRLERLLAKHGIKDLVYENLTK